MGSLTIIALQPKPKLETLDDLLAQAEQYANHSMRNLGRMPPTLFLIGPDGPRMFMPESLEDGAAKDAFATNSRLMCIAHAATSVVMAIEAWAKFAKPDEKFDETEPPSEAFDRREFVILMGESHGGLPPDHVVEDIDAILASTERIAGEHHDGENVSVVVAPCSPFSVTPELMRESAALARRHGLRLHTHLAETVEENAYLEASSGVAGSQQTLLVDGEGALLQVAAAGRSIRRTGSLPSTPTRGDLNVEGTLKGDVRVLAPRL